MSILKIVIALSYNHRKLRSFRHGRGWSMAEAYEYLFIEFARDEAFE